MDLIVFAAVLFSAACHAGWNAVIKTGFDPVATTVLVALGAGFAALPLMAFAGLPDPAAWPWVAASVIIHLAYFSGLIESYRAGDMGQVYPLARGAAPLMTAAASTVLVGEHLGIAAWLGIAALAAGVVLMSARGGRGLHALDRRAVAFALFTALAISAYTLVDGIGARASGNANAYSAALFAGNGIAMAVLGLIWRGADAFAPMLRRWKSGLAGGAMQVIAYGIVIWAMTVAPIAIVAALRETSVLFGAVLAVVLLREPPRRSRIAAALLIVCGLALVRAQ